MKRNLILMGVLVSLIGLPNARGQSITPSTLNGTGGSFTLGSTIYDYSIGEMTLVSTDYVDSVIVTQGLLQNDISIPASVPNTQLAQYLKVFPNPASSLVNLQYTSSDAGTLGYRLMDMAGKVILQNTADVTPGTTKEQINVSKLAVADYMLEVFVKSGAGTTETSSYKIQKLQ